MGHLLGMVPCAEAPHPVGFIWSVGFYLSLASTFPTHYCPLHGLVSLLCAITLKRWDAFREKNLSLSDYLLLQGIFSAILPNWKLLLKDGENNNNQIDKTVSDDDVQDITRMTSKSIYSTLVKRIQIPLTAQSKFNSLYNISGIID